MNFSNYVLASMLWMPSSTTTPVVMLSFPEHALNSNCSEGTRGAGVPWTQTVLTAVRKCTGQASGALSSRPHSKKPMIGSHRSWHAGCRLPCSRRSGAEPPDPLLPRRDGGSCLVRVRVRVRVRVIRARARARARARGSAARATARRGLSGGGRGRGPRAEAWARRSRPRPTAVGAWSRAAAAASRADRAGPPGAGSQ